MVDVMTVETSTVRLKAITAQSQHGACNVINLRSSNAVPIQLGSVCAITGTSEFSFKSIITPTYSIAYFANGTIPSNNFVPTNATYNTTESTYTSALYVLPVTSTNATATEKTFEPIKGGHKCTASTYASGGFTEVPVTSTNAKVTANTFTPTNCANKR